MNRILVMLVLLSAATAASAQEAATREAAPEAQIQQPHPVFSADGSWAGPLVVFGIIGMLFLPAAVIGPIVRALTPEEVPPAHSHDEPPGTSGHHGRSGTVDTDDHGHGH
jgi:hypothetical protein